MILIYCAIFLLSPIYSDQKCPDLLAVDITNGQKIGNSIMQNGIKFDELDYFHKDNGTIMGCICNKKMCIRKCCGVNEVMIGKNCTALPKSSASLAPKLKFYDGTYSVHGKMDFHVISNNYCPYDKTLLFPNFTEPGNPDNFFVQLDGSLYMPLMDGENRFPLERYCVDWFTNDNMDNEFSALLCFPTEELLGQGLHISETLPIESANEIYIQKCCGQNEILKDKNCVNGSASSNNLFDNFKLDYNKSCHGFILNFEQDRLDLKDTGQLYIPETSETVNITDYCLDYFANQNSLVAIVCFQENGSESEENTAALYSVEEDKNSDESQPDLRAVLYCTGMIISMPFLLLTFIVYALLPDRNLHMKALMSYVLSLFLGYLCLVIINLSNDSFEKPFCKTLGYSALFFFMVSFLWMNVICVDIWLAFSGLRGYNGSRKHSERKRFLLYCAYAWGMAVLHELVVFLIDENTAEEKQLWYDPGIGGAQCFIYMGYPELLYFYGPMAILIIINAVLFSITAIKIRRVKKDTSMLKKDDSKRHSYESDKQKFNLYVKLLFAMGVNWSLEIISWAVMWQITDASVYIWYLPDFCNAIYGVFIFFIFVFKRSTWKMLKKRYYSFIGKPYLAHSMTNNQRITSYSTTNTSLPADSRNSGVNTESAVLTTEA